MKALWIVLALVVTVCTGLWVWSQIDLPVDRSSTYIQIEHQGSQDKTPPLLRIGTVEGLPPQPFSSMSRNEPAPLSLDFTLNVAIDDTRFFRAVKATRNLKCRDSFRDKYLWSEITVSVFVHGRLASFCLLETEGAEAYMRAVNDATDGNLSDYTGKRTDPHDELIDESESKAWLDKDWTALRHDGLPTIFFGTKTGLDEAAKQQLDAHAVRLKLTRSKVQLMTLTLHDAQCINDTLSPLADDEVHIVGNEGRGCRSYGIYACYYLNKLYSLSLPDNAIENIEAVKTLASRLGCRPEGWGKYRYVELYRENPDWSKTSVVRLGTEAGLPPPEAATARIVLSDAQFGQMNDLLHHPECSFGGFDKARDFVIAPYHDGLLQVECGMEAPAARAYLAKVVAITGPSAATAFQGLESALPADRSSTYIQIDHQGSQEKSPPVGAAVGNRPRPSFDSRYNYLELRHDGAEDKPYPRIWLGTAEDQVPRLDPKDIRDTFNGRIILTPAKYQAVMDAGKGLMCRDAIKDPGWDEVTVTRITAGKPGPGCILQGRSARTYLNKVVAIVDGDGADHDVSELEQYRFILNN